MSPPADTVPVLVDPVQTAAAAPSPDPAAAQAVQGPQTAQAPQTAPTPQLTAQVAALTQAGGGAPDGSVKITAARAAAGSVTAPSSAFSPTNPVTAQSPAADTDAQTAAAVTAVASQNGNQGGDQSSVSDNGTNASPSPGGSAPPSSPDSAPLSGGGQTATASWADASSSTQTDSASASSGTPTPVALGLLGDPPLIQQVPVTAQGAGSASTGAVLPPGMDSKTLALDPAAGGNTALTGDVASAAAAAATQGSVQTEEPSAANTASSAGFSQSMAAAANPSEQVKVQLTKGLKDGSDTINVLLHPEDLGTVEVKLQMQDGQVKATISADNPETLALLKTDQHQLTQSLQNAGFNTDSNSLNFQLRGEQQQSNGFAQQQGQGSGQGSNSGSNSSGYTTDSDIDDQVQTATANGASSKGGLDISV